MRRRSGSPTSPSSPIASLAAPRRCGPTARAAGRPFALAVGEGPAGPLLVELAPGEALALVGPPDATAAVARGLVLRLAEAHGPADLAIDATAARRELWRWTDWLPHTGGPLADHAAGAVATDDQPEAGATLLVLDDPAGLERRSGPARRRLAAGASADRRRRARCPAGPRVPPRRHAHDHGVRRGGGAPRTSRRRRRSRGSRSLHRRRAVAADGARPRPSAGGLARSRAARLDGAPRGGPPRLAPGSVGVGSGRHGRGVGRPSPGRRRIVADPARGCRRRRRRRRSRRRRPARPGRGHDRFRQERAAPVARRRARRPPPAVGGRLPPRRLQGWERVRRAAPTCRTSSAWSPTWTATSPSGCSAASRPRCVGGRSCCGPRAATTSPPPGPQARALSRLVVVIDEFATLATELPELLRSIVNIARRGRSLGVHLVLATQRPGAAVSDEIRANTNLRIALRVQDVDRVERRRRRAHGGPPLPSPSRPGRGAVRRSRPRDHPDGAGDGTVGPRRRRGRPAPARHGAGRRPVPSELDHLVGVIRRAAMLDGRGRAPPALARSAARRARPRRPAAGIGGAGRPAGRAGADAARLGPLTRPPPPVRRGRGRAPRRPSPRWRSTSPGRRPPTTCTCSSSTSPGSSLRWPGWLTSAPSSGPASPSASPESCGSCGPSSNGGDRRSSPASTSRAWSCWSTAWAPGVTRSTTLAGRRSTISTDCSPRALASASSWRPPPTGPGASRSPWPPSRRRSGCSSPPIRPSWPPSVCGPLTPPTWCPGRFVDAAARVEAQCGRAADLGAAVAALAGRWPPVRRPAPRVGTLPACIRLGESGPAGGGRAKAVPSSSSSGSVTSSSKPVPLVVHPGDHVLVAGPSRSGRSTALATIAAAVRAISPGAWIGAVAPRPIAPAGVDGVRRRVDRRRARSAAAGWLAPRGRRRARRRPRSAPGPRPGQCRAGPARRGRRAARRASLGLRALDAARAPQPPRRPAPAGPARGRRPARRDAAPPPAGPAACPGAATWSPMAASR